MVLIINTNYDNSVILTQKLKSWSNNGFLSVLEQIYVVMVMNYRVLCIIHHLTQWVSTDIINMDGSHPLRQKANTLWCRKSHQCFTSSDKRYDKYYTVSISENFFYWKSTIAAIEANNETYWLQKRIKKFKQNVWWKHVLWRKLFFENSIICLPQIYQIRSDQIEFFATFLFVEPKFLFDSACNCNEIVNVIDY